LTRADADGRRPHALALDSKGQRLYFTDLSSEQHSIARVDLSGDKVNLALLFYYYLALYVDQCVCIQMEEMLELDQETPHGLALDVVNKKLYWAETGSQSVRVGTIADIGQEPSSNGASSTFATLALSTTLVALSLFL
jgi:sugar lactone lactonase YvrE